MMGTNSSTGTSNFEGGKEKRKEKRKGKAPVLETIFEIVAIL